MGRPRADEGREPGARERLLEATAQIMEEEGYAAATSRRVATRAGVKPALVYYYFPTMDDLFLAVLRAGAETVLERHRLALSEADPLRALWRINSDTRTTRLNTEFIALANHRKAIGAELKAYAERVRDIETTALTVAMRAHGVDLDDFPPVVISMFLTGLARTMVNEAAMGVTRGHEEARLFMERYIGRFETLASPPERAGPVPDSA
ncbi:TetR/AcrR family transcriptional regulator [Rhodococcus phenolicus]|uniref:TetR/AcrR family transcriptional regulator n=1 Tax=Rhodococcus phenolicus TaxID=263849 RepID=UPI0009EDE88F|nr:TetR/AcrR family transcriptional regulator [Rhodococcus phenolicus]